MQSSKIQEVAETLSALGARRVLFTDIDGTSYKWQLLIDLVLAVAKDYPNKRVLIKPLAEAIKGYRKRIVPFSVVINILISIIPEVFKGIDKKRVEKSAAARVRQVTSLVYIFPKTLYELLKGADFEKDPWVLVAITGAPQEVADPFCKTFSMHVTIGSDYKVDANGIYTGKRDIDSGNNKGAILEAVADACPQIDWPCCIALGDSENDLPMFKRCGFSIAINPNTDLLDAVRDSGSAHNPICMVRDGQKSGVQIYRPNSRGVFQEITVSDALPPDVAKLFPVLPGMQA